MSKRLDELGAELEEYNRQHNELSKRVDEILKNEPDKYALVKTIAGIVWKGLQAWEGGWLSFSIAIGKELLGQIKNEQTE